MKTQVFKPIGVQIDALGHRSGELLAGKAIDIPELLRDKGHRMNVKAALKLCFTAILACRRRVSLKKDRRLVALSPVDRGVPLRGRIW